MENNPPSKKTIFKQEQPKCCLLCWYPLPSWCRWWPSRCCEQVTYRIPALLYISENKTFLAFAEKRKTADDTDADVLVMRKGIWKDDGVEWDSSQELLTSVRQENRRCMNPCPVFVRETKTLFLFFITLPVGVSESDQKCRNKNQAQLCYITSKDTGKNWSEITNLTADVIGEQEKNWATFAVGPGHGVQLKSGRLIIPAYAYRYTGNPNCRSCCCLSSSCFTSYALAFYSDDQGNTWKVGNQMNVESCESQMAEIIDKKENVEQTILYCNARTTHGYRTEVLSYNAGQDFEPGSSKTKLKETGEGCQGSVLSFLQQRDPPKTWLLYSHPSNLKNRDDLGLYLNKTPLDFSGWSDAPVMILHRGPSAYADLVEHEPGRFACLMECGTKHENEEIAFLLFELPAIKP